MTRVPMGGRRTAVSMSMSFKADGQNDIDFAVTYGFDDYAGPVREIFCKPFLIGAAMNHLMRQAVMVISVALQHGARMGELAHVIGEDKSDQAPRSLVGLIVRTGVNLDAERGHVWAKETRDA